MKIFMEILQRIRYKLRIMGVLISGPFYIYGNNMSFIHNTHSHESTLNKNINFICYHTVRECVAMGESLTGHVGTTNNCADLATKVLYGVKRSFLMSKLLYDIYDDLRAFAWQSWPTCC